VQYDSATSDTATSWAKHNLEQLRIFRALSLRAKLEAVQGMADVVRHLSALRAAGKLYASEVHTES
jgi:hypothetical protein